MEVFLKEGTAQKSLVWENNLSQQIVQSLSDGILTLDMQGRILSCNSMMMKKLSARAEDLKGRKIWSILSPIPRVRWLEMLGRVERTKRTVHWGAMQIRTNGHAELVKLRTVPLKGTMGQLQGTINIFEYQRTEREPKEGISENKRFYEVLLRDINEGVLVIKDRKILWCNRPAEKITGYTQAEMLGQSTAMLFPDRKTFLDFGQVMSTRLSRRSRFDTELKLRRKSGEIFDAEFSLSTMRRSDGHVREIIAVGRDVSTRKRAAREVKERARSLAILNQVTAKVGSSIKLKSVMLYSAKSILKLSGLDGCSVVLYDEDSDTLKDFISIGLKKEFQKSLKWRLRPGGVTSWVVKNKQPLVIYNTLKDPRSATSRATRIAHVRALVVVPILSKGHVIGLIFVNSFQAQELSSDIVSIISSIASQAAGAIENAKLYRQVFEKVTELSALYAVSKVLVSTLDVDHLLQQVVNVLHVSFDYSHCAIFLREREGNKLSIRAAHGIPRQRIRDLLVDADGKGIIAWVVRNAKQLYVPDVGCDPRFISELKGIKSELTVPLVRGNTVIGALDVESKELDAYGERDMRILTTVAAQLAMAVENVRLYKGAKRAYEDLKAAQADVVQAGKMAAVGQLAAGIAHELNNPIGGIMGYAQFSLSKMEKLGVAGEGESEDIAADISRYLQHIEKESQRCKAIVQNLLNFSRTAPLAYHQVDVNFTVSESLQFIEHGLTAHKIEVEKKLANDLPHILGNENQLQQVFVNIILNAQKAMPQGGKLTVTTSCCKKDENSSECIEVLFRDTGVGISQENISRIFEPFFTTRKIGEGTGLGLSVSYQIMKKHGGEIKVESRQDIGTTFILRLPLQPSSKQ
ncbi:GAF domain-containing protein [Candidatus Zixiibacteriota bacterium]